jgi:3-phosphoshikimate 1-carboxyvinyltransferase
LGSDIKSNETYIDAFEIDPENPSEVIAVSKKKLLSYTVKGRASFSNAYGNVNSIRPKRIDVGNSGTSLFFIMAQAAVSGELFYITADEQTQKRSAGPLLNALNALGANAKSINENDCAPFVIQGPYKGGKTDLLCPTSQYLSALLLALPLAEKGVVADITVPLLNERPYIDMTLSYLAKQKIPVTYESDFSHFTITGGFSYKRFSDTVPGDFSSAAFPACAAALTGGPLTLLGLDPNDTQGDSFFFEILTKMGCTVNWEKIMGTDGNYEHAVTVSREGPLKSGVFDLNATPDLLPAACVLGAFATGETSFVNVKGARIKESDRIHSMATELKKLGVTCSEKEDGIVISGAGLEGVNGGEIESYKDHRIVLAFAAAGTKTLSPLSINDADCASISYPDFIGDIIRADIIT